MIIINISFWLLVYFLAAVAVRLIPVSRFKPDRGIFRESAFEKKTRLYSLLRVEDWSKAFDGMVRMGGFEKGYFSQQVTVSNAAFLIRDACVMESFHWMVLIAGGACFFLAPVVAASAMFAANALISLTGILCMRFSRRHIRNVRNLLANINRANVKIVAQKGLEWEE